jgi:hypothetical protein
MSLRGLARGALRVAGVVLMALGVVHLIATPHIPHLLDAMPKKARDFAVGPTLLNHVLVGILLMPLGFSTWLAADARHAGESWARRVLTGNCLAVLTLPLAVIILMRAPQYYHAPLFLAGVGLTAVAALTMVLATWVVVSAKP